MRVAVMAAGAVGGYFGGRRATSRPTPSVDPVTSTVLFSMFIRYQEPDKIGVPQG
jgi:hypothetical protein